MSSESLGNEAQGLMREIDYQVFRPEVTTMGPCPFCDRPSRGARRCMSCTTKELGLIVGTAKSVDYLNKALDLAEARRNIFTLAEFGH